MTPPRVTLVLGLLFSAFGATSGQRPVPAARPVSVHFDVMEKTIDELQEAMRAGSTTARELVDIYLARIDAYDARGPKLNAMVVLNPRAREEAAALDRERSSGHVRGPLHGIPIVVKDNSDVVGLSTSAGTLAFAALFPADDAFQVKKLRDAGAVILGKTNLQELASGITTISSLGGQTRNPYDLTRNPGGSSGGTGAAVAANYAVAGMGSDTCGSIRIPSSHNSLVGLRGTYGLSSRDGVLPLSHSQDIAGPLARTVTDVALVLDATVGFDSADESTRIGEGHRPASYRDGLRADALKGSRIGILASMFGDAPEDGEAGGLVRRAVQAMAQQGAETFDVAVPGLDDLLRNSSVIDAEFKFDLQDYLAKVPNAAVHSLGEIVDRGLYTAAVESSIKRRNAIDARETDAYRRARVKREAVRHAVLAAFEEQRLDALVYPTMRRRPARIDDPQSGSTCQLSAASGLPALSMPAGFTNDGLPIGIELLGPAFSEPRLLALAYAFEQSQHVRRPPFSTPALVNGGAPPPIAFDSVVRSAVSPATLTVHFTLDPVTAELKYVASVVGLSPEEVAGAWIHRGASDDSGPAVLQVLAHRRLQASAVSTLTPPDLNRLRDGTLYLALHTTGNARAPDRSQLLLPGPSPLPRR
jgi:amidase